MTPVITYGGMTGLRVNRLEPVENRRTGKWEVAEVGTYKDVKELNASTEYFDSFAEAMKYVVERMARRREYGKAFDNMTGNAMEQLDAIMKKAGFNTKPETAESEE